MNKDRLSRLHEVSSTLEAAIDEVQEIIDEEYEAYDNLPEGLQCSSRGDIMQEYISGMEEIVGKISELADEISEYEL